MHHCALRFDARRGRRRAMPNCVGVVNAEQGFPVLTANVWNRWKTDLDLVTRSKRYVWRQLSEAQTGDCSSLGPFSIFSK